MQHEAVTGWQAPVYQSLAQPMLTAGVPSNLFMLSMVSTLAMVMVWWPVVALQAVFYSVAKRLTEWDPLWAGILSRYLSYSQRYEG